MPLTVSNPRDLLLAQLGDLLWVERTLARAVLPELIAAAHDDDLKDVLSQHLEQTRKHVGNVEDAFRALESEPSSMHSPPVEALKRQHDEVAGSIKQSALKDLYGAAAAAHTEHYEIAAYTGLVSLAGALDEGEVQALLEENLEDEQQALKELERVSKKLAKQLKA